MKMRGGKLCFVLSILVVIVAMDFSSASFTNSNGTAEEDINGEMLLKMGRTLDKPIITLLGMAIRNLETLHPCYDWTQWSDCGAIKEGYIASRTRMRKCDRYQSENKVTTETDIDICEGFCPKDYNLTTNGFCVKLYVGPKSFDDAEKQCQADGGNMINIDSELKYGDVKNFVKRLTSHIYIDGRRKDLSSPWLLQNGSQKLFFKWGSGEPNSNLLCIYVNYSNGLFYDSSCSSNWKFMCEMK